MWARIGVVMQMALVFINGNSARCRDCGYYEYTGKLSAADPHDGRCTNAKHVKTHGGGSGRVNGKQRTCFDAEGKAEEDQITMEGM